MRFTNGYVSHPFCSPTRAGLLTGRYQQRFGHENNPAYLPEDTTVGLPVDQVTLSQMMKDAGYATGVVGKWHLGAAPCFYPSARGFTDFFGFLGGGHSYFPTPPAALNTRSPSCAITCRWPRLATSPTTSARGRGLRDPPQGRALLPLPGLQRRAHPLQAPRRPAGEFAASRIACRAHHAAMLAAMDEAIGKLLGKRSREQGWSSTPWSSSSATTAAPSASTVRATPRFVAPRARCTRAASGCPSSCSGRASCRPARPTLNR